MNKSTKIINIAINDEGSNSLNSLPAHNLKIDKKEKRKKRTKIICKEQEKCKFYYRIYTVRNFK